MNWDANSIEEFLEDAMPLGEQIERGLRPARVTVVRPGDTILVVVDDRTRAADMDRMRQSLRGQDFQGCNVVIVAAQEVIHIPRERA